MSDAPPQAITAYVEAAAVLTKLPLDADRVHAAAVAMTRIADFAADVEAFALGDDVEIAGTFPA
ncbi:MAG: AtzG-like protein [Candidatus Velthaea sp.]|jgi:hypothetical protein